MVLTTMNHSFAEFLTRLQARDDAAANEPFKRFAHQPRAPESAAGRTFDRSAVSSSG
jgi:hypothetical protein